MTLLGTGWSSNMPLTFARGRNGDVYGVNGHQRGFRWDGITGSLEQLGITGPSTAPTVTTSTANARQYLSGIEVVDAGQGYRIEPRVYIGGGGTETKSVTGDATTDVFTSNAHGMANGTCVQFESLTGGSGLSLNRPYYVIDTASNTFKLASSFGGAAVNFTTALSAGTLRLPASTAGIARANVSRGQVTTVDIMKYGVGYTSPPTVTCDPPEDPVGGGTGCVLTVTTDTFGTGDLEFPVVSGVNVTNGGFGFSGRPRVVIRDPDGGVGAFCEPVLDNAGQIVSCGMLAPGAGYTAGATAEVIPDWSQVPRIATLRPVMRYAIKGKYWCAIRYVDDTVSDKGGPIPSSISPLRDVEVVDPGGSFAWTIPTAGLEARVSKIQLWRTSADQVTVLYKVAEVNAGTSSYSDTLSDAELTDPTRNGFDVLPIVLPNGQLNARRFTPPPQNKAVIAMFQDRAWYGVDVPGRTFTGGTDANAGEPNTLYFSEANEPESVPEANELIIQENVKGQDRITALMPFGGGMVVFQERHAYRLAFVSQPLIDASITLIGQRGCLNQRCWDVYDGVAYVVDSMGMYMLDGNNAVPLSDSVDTYWQDNVIHFASSKWFFVRVDPVTRIARFFFSASAGYPDRALCFHPITKAWWEERYAQTFASTECVTIGGRQAIVAGGQAGAFCRFDSGNQDLNSAGAAVGIACSHRTGFFPFVKEPSRSVRVLYKPTSSDCNLSLALHYNGSATARPAAVQTNRGTGFTTDQNQNATLNLKLSRSTLGDATGYAVASYVGGVEDKSSGGDRHLGVAISLTRPSSEGVTIYGMGMDGVGT